MRWRLAGMMALLYGVQGSWYPLLAVHLKDLGISGASRGLIFSTFAVGCLVSPLGIGQLADRFVSANRLLGIIFAVASGLLLVMASGVFDQGWSIFLLFLAYWLVVSSAMGLSNTIAMRNLGNPKAEFGRVRLWGTIGWMAAGWIVALAILFVRVSQGGAVAFSIGALIAATLSLYSLQLPETPPLATGAKRGWRSARRDVGTLIRRPIVAFYLLTAFGVTMTLPYMFQVQPPYLESIGLPRPWIGPAMTLGQVSEVGALWLLPFLIQRFGERITLAVGILAWAVRYGTLALDPPLWVAVIGIPLHGFGIAFFTIAGMMFLDSHAPPDRRASAQGLQTFVTAGVGALSGNLLAGLIVNRFGDSSVVFIVPFVVNTGLFVLWVSVSGQVNRISQRDGRSGEADKRHSDLLKAHKTADSDIPSRPR